MTDVELAALEAAAKAATPGQKRDIEAYSAFIAAANPAVVLELIAELRRLRAELHWSRLKSLDEAIEGGTND